MLMLEKAFVNWVYRVCCVCGIQALSSLDAREIAFTVLEQLPDVTNLNKDTFKVVCLIL